MIMSLTYFGHWVQFLYCIIGYMIHRNIDNYLTITLQL